MVGPRILKDITYKMVSQLTNYNIKWSSEYKMNHIKFVVVQSDWTHYPINAAYKKLE